MSEISFSFILSVTFLSFCLYSLFQWVYIPLFSSPLSRIPGHKFFALTRWRLAYEDWSGTRTPAIHKLHLKYGDAVRVGPNEVSFNSLSALRTIYGAGSGFERHTFYRMFDVYGRQNLFTFGSTKLHGDRKKLLNHAYSKSYILKGEMATLIETKTRQYMRLLETEPETAFEIFTSLHYFSLDSITHFLYGPTYGGTSALTGSATSRALLSDILEPTRRKLAWFAIHFPAYTKWLYSQTGHVETLITKVGLLPMAKPSTYTGIRAHSLQAMHAFQSASPSTQAALSQNTIIGRLFAHRATGKPPLLDALDIASECADHLLAGIDTTSDTLMFLIWALSQPAHARFQRALIAEIAAMDPSVFTDGVPRVADCDKLPYLDAVIKETLRLYAPLPASEPRSIAADTMIGGYLIPARTVVGMMPYSLHRNAEVFPEPLKFDPERWLGGAGDVAEMKKWWWAFSSGGRMCIGLHLAMAEMTTLATSIYRKYRTSLMPEQEGVSPGITSRFEVFCDETMPVMKEHTCWIDFQKL